MAVEYSLYNVKDIENAEKVAKIRIKIISSFEKNIDSQISKENNDKLIDSLENLKKKVISSIEKDFIFSAEGEAICTITSTKKYTEMSLEELEKKMSASEYIVLGDDGSKFKTFSSFEKIYNKNV